jgi:hypothetical protein
MIVLRFSVQQENVIDVSVLMANVMCRCLDVQEEGILEHVNNAKCQFCTLESTRRPLCNTCVHLVVTLLSVLMPRYQ